MESGFGRTALHRGHSLGRLFSRSVAKNSWLSQALREPDLLHYQHPIGLSFTYPMAAPPLSLRLARFVTRSAQTRGAEYFAARRVHVLHTTEVDVHVMVRGSHPNEYEVSIAREGNAFLAACSCPYFCDSLELCKHIWATVLAVEQKSLLLGDTGAYPADPQLEPMAPEEAGLVDDDYEDDDFALEPWQPPPPRVKPARVVVRPDRWTEFAERLAHAPQPAASPLSTAPEQLLYLIDVRASLQASALVMEIVGRDRKQNGEFGKPRSDQADAR